MHSSSRAALRAQGKSNNNKYHRYVFISCRTVLISMHVQYGGVCICGCVVYAYVWVCGVCICVGVNVHMYACVCMCDVCGVCVCVWCVCDVWCV